MFFPHTVIQVMNNKNNNNNNTSVQPNFYFMCWILVAVVFLLYINLIWCKIWNRYICTVMHILSILCLFEICGIHVTLFNHVTSIFVQKVLWVDQNGIDHRVIGVRSNFALILYISTLLYCLHQFFILYT